MNTHNVNVKTAAQEPSERYGLKSFSPVMADGLAQLVSLREQRMPLDERAELLAGTLCNLAEALCATVTDWSLSRPLLPLAAVSAWVAAGEFVLANFGDLGEAAWDYAVRHLRVQLAAGHAMFTADVA
ncbi:hypothetical protein [Erwinia typographi]|nr:hypothetical protein [Erwinia typographi]